MFKPLYIPYLQGFNKNIKNTNYVLILSFICFYVSLWNEFYFSNEQIKENLWISIKTISRAIKYLEDNKYIKCFYKTSRNWWTYREIKLKIENPLEIKNNKSKAEYLSTIDGFLSIQSKEVKQAAKKRIKDRYDKVGQYPTLKQLKKRLIDKGYQIIEK